METSSKIENVQENCAAANVTDGGEAVPKCWYAACVRMNCERKVAGLIESLGIETFVPQQTQTRQWSDRRKKVQVVVIPLIVFIRATEEEARRVMCLSQVSRLLSAPGQRKPAVIPDKQMDVLKFLLYQEEKAVAFSGKLAKKGDKVRIVRGHLAGVEGVVVQVENSKSLAIEINMIGYAMVKIDKEDVEVAT